MAERQKLWEEHRKAIEVSRVRLGVRDRIIETYRAEIESY